MSPNDPQTPEARVFDIGGYLLRIVNCTNPAPCEMCARAAARIGDEWDTLLAEVSRLRAAQGSPEPPICNVCDEPIRHELVCENCLPDRGFTAQGSPTADEPTETR